MGQSLVSVFTPQEVEVLLKLANGHSLSVDDVALTLGCEEDEVHERMFRISSLIGYPLCRSSVLVGTA